MSSGRQVKSQNLQQALENDPWTKYFNKHLQGAVSKRVASPGSRLTPPSSYNILAFSATRIFFWSSAEAALITSNLQDSELRTTTVIECDIDPISEVNSIDPSPVGCSLALIGNRGVSILDVGPDESIPNSGRKIGRCIAIAERFFLNNPKVAVLQFQWLPHRETHVVLLTSDNCLRIFKISKPSQTEILISLHGPTTKRSLHNFTAFTVVSLDTKALPGYHSSPSDYSRGSYVIYTLRSDGSVYTCDMTVGNERIIVSNMRGPLNPEAPFGTDIAQLATSILHISADLPVLVISTNSSKVFHGIILDKDDIEVEIDSPSSGSISFQSELLFIERLELVNTQGVLSKKRGPSRLISHDNFPSCYVLSTDQQLIGVSLPWLADLSLLIQSRIDFDSLRPSAVQTVISLDPFDNTEDIRLLGARLVAMDSIECSLLSVASNGQVTLQKIIDQNQIQPKEKFPQPDFSFGSDLSPHQKSGNKAPFSDRIATILRRDSSLPVFTFADADKITAEDLSALVRQGVKIYEEQYLTKQRQAYEEIIARKQRLESRKKNVTQMLLSMEKNVKSLENGYFEFLNKNDLTEMDGISLQDRITYLQEEFSKYNPTLTDAEKQLEENLHTLASKIDKLEEVVESMERKLVYKEKVPKALFSDDLDASLLTQLSAESCRIESLKRRIGVLRAKLEV